MDHVLLSNDDGVFAPGLRALADAFLADGFRVTVAAPDGERSAAAHSITIKRPLVAKRTVYDGAPQGAPLTVWAIDGTPADCVKLAVHELVDSPPALVVSGINNGWNIGTDIHYSGTVGAAMEAAFEGYAGMAVSAKRPDAERYANAARLAAVCARRLLRHPLPMPSILNLNLPDCVPDAVRGLVEAPLTRIQYTDAYDRMPRDHGGDAFWLKGDIIEEGCQAGSDLDRLAQGFATVTAIGWDLSIRDACASLLQDDQ
ncbi:5'/3'-nucleotidase SurE [Eubacteriales bacterium OttesenSCG-928-A19]|nr:5'/3'-nucleotidase SurE [Eubacteriales bacterium OttesenSCG-928-A19]